MNPTAVSRTSFESQSTAHKAAIEIFFRGLEEHNVDTIAPLLANEIVQEIMFSTDGSQAPSPRFEGKKAVLSHLNQIVTMFSRTVLVDKRVYVTEDGTVFMEAKGDLVHADTGAPYMNVYVFKFVFRSNLISRISEYGNPVTFAKLVGAGVNRPGLSEAPIH